MNGKTRPSSFFRRTRFETHLTDRHVHLGPFERKDLARGAPARDARERRDALHVARQLIFDPLKLIGFEEAAADVAFLEQWNVRRRGDLAALDGQGEHPFQGNQIAIDRRVGCALCLSVRM